MAAVVVGNRREEMLDRGVDLASAINLIVECVRALAIRAQLFGKFSSHPLLSFPGPSTNNSLGHVETACHRAAGPLLSGNREMISHGCQSRSLRICK